MVRRRRGPRSQLPASLSPCRFCVSLPLLKYEAHRREADRQTTQYSTPPLTLLTAFPSLNYVHALLSWPSVAGIFTATTRHIRNRASLDGHSPSLKCESLQVCFQKSCFHFSQERLGPCNPPYFQEENSKSRPSDRPYCPRRKRMETERALGRCLFQDTQAQVHDP